jgi:hypothetical protein
MQASDHPVLLPGIEVHAVEDGCVVWVPATGQVHFLNDTAMRVLRLCDGTRESAAFQAEFGEVGDVGFDVSSGILDQFEAARIIAPGATRD